MNDFDASKGRPTNARFEATRWTVIERLRDGDDAERKQAMSDLCTQYWSPVYALGRRQGLSAADASDFAQYFFERVVLHRELFQNAERREDAKLRTLIRKSATNAFHDFRSNMAVGLGRQNQHVSLDPIDHRIEGQAADDAFDQEFDWCIMRAAFEHARNYYENAGRSQEWELVCEALIFPMARGTKSPPHAELAEKYGFKSAREVTIAVHRARQRLNKSLLAAVAETTPYESVQQEYRRIRDQYGRRRSG